MIADANAAEQKLHYTKSRPIPWLVLQSLFDALYPKGLQWHWKTDFLTELIAKASPCMEVKLSFVLIHFD